MKRLVCIFLVMILFLTMLPLTAIAVESVASGYCGGEGDGTNIAWTLNHDGILTLSGKGKMADYNIFEDKYAPWNSWRDSIYKAIISDGITTIGNDSFYCCRLEKVSIPSGVISIGTRAFDSCRLTTLELPEGVVSIGDSAFESAFTLESKGGLKIPDSVKQIGENAFSLNYFSAINLGNGVEEIGAFAFSSSENLTTIHIPESVTLLDNTAFFISDNLATITVNSDNPNYSASNGMLFNKDASTLISVMAGVSGVCTIPDTVENLENGALDYCGKVKEYRIPSSLATGLECWEFDDCTSLEAIVVHEDNPSYKSIDGALLSKDGTQLIRVPQATRGRYVVPCGVKWANGGTGGTFEDCTQITEIVFQNYVNPIANMNGGLATCTSLESVYLYGDWWNVGSNEWDYETNKPIEGFGTFSGCKSLKDVYFDGDAPEIAYSPISEFPSFDEGVTIHYKEGTSGWTSPTWNGYNTEIWKPVEEEPPEVPGEVAIERLSPANGATDVEYHMAKTQDLYVYFDRPLELATTSKPVIDFEAGGVRVYRAVDDYCILDAKENPYLADTSDDVNCVTSDSKILVIKTAGTSQLFEPDTEYYVEIDEGVLSFEDGSVNPAIGREDWSFTTKSFDTSLLYGDYNEYLGSERARMYLSAPRLELMEALDSYAGTETKAAAVWAASKSLDIGFWLERGWNKLTKGETIGDALIKEAEEAFFEKFVLGASQVYTNTQTISIIDSFIKSVNFGEGVVEENYWNVFFEANWELLTDKTRLSKKELKTLLQEFIQETNDEEFRERMSGIISGFEGFGDFMTEAERAVVLAELFTTVVALSQVELEVLNNLIAGLGKSRYINSEIYEELCTLREKISSGDYEQIVGKYLSEAVIDEVFGLVSEVVKLVFSPNKWLKLGLSVFAEVYDIKNNSVGDIMQANIAMSYAGMMYYTLVDVQDWYDEHGIRMSEKDIAQYEELVKLYHYAVKLGADKVGTVVDRCSKYRVEEAKHLLGDAQSWWEGYENICLQDLYTEMFHDEKTGLRYEVNDGKVTIVGAELQEMARSKVSKNRTLVVPSQIDGVPVVSVADHAFAGVSGLEHVILPEGIETIGDGSFLGCTDLCYLSVPAGVKTVGSQAVSSCEKLTTISLPESVENVGDNAFAYCPQLGSVFVFGYDTSLGKDVVSESNATMIAMTGSATETYARKQGISFEEMHLAAVSMKVIQEPEKTSYEIGEAFDDSGMVVEVEYADGSKQEFTSGWSVLCDTSKAGKIVVEIFAEGCVAELTVTVQRNNTGGTERPHTKLPVIHTIDKNETHFVDIEIADWFYDAVRYVYTNGLMNGLTDNLFAPDMTMTRGMIVTILHRLDGEPAADVSGFEDVGQDAYYAEAVAWAAENGIVTGVDAQNFAPDMPVTREQLAAILYRYAEYKGCDVGICGNLNLFADAASVSDYALSAMEWAVSVGIINGIDGTQLWPAGTATRAQAAAMFMRFCDQVV